MGKSINNYMNNTKQCSKCKQVKDLSYFHNSKCSKDGHKNQCKICRKTERNPELLKEYERNYYKKNKERKQEYLKQWRIKNKEHLREYDKEYYKRRPDIKLACTKRYLKTHPEKKRELERKRRAKKVEINEHYTKSDEEYTKNVFNNQCANCGSTENLCIDHHYPLSKGHALTRQNAVVLCNSCNSSKQDKNPEEFYDSLTLQHIEEKLN